MKPVGIALVAAALTGCATVPLPDPAQASLLMRYAISQCIAVAYPDTPVAADANVAAGGYLEFGSLEIDAYAESTALAKRTAALTYRAQGGQPAHVMKCLDLLASPEMKRLVERHVPAEKREASR